MKKNSKRHSPETIAKMRAAKRGWQPPAGFEDLYVVLKKKLGAGEAKRLVLNDVAMRERRSAA